MQIRKLTVAVIAAGALGASLLVTSPASADYAPGAGDAVGVGSDTVQFLSDFVADGNFLGAVGYNGGGGLNRLVSFDATADSNARLAYGTGGSGSTCAPGTGASLGTGNQNTTHSEATNAKGTVCQLNPTIVLRAGLTPINRPNGSGAGASAMANDMLAGNRYIDYSRASSLSGGKFTAAGQSAGRIQIGAEQFAMMTSTSSHAPAGGLTASQLQTIYSSTQCNSTATNTCFGHAGCAKWSDVGGTGTTQIIPIIPQINSGTRNFFVGTSGINVTSVSDCAVVAEENDPEALDVILVQMVNVLRGGGGERP